MKASAALLGLVVLGACGEPPLPDAGEFAVRVECERGDVEFGAALRFTVVRSWRKTLVPAPFAEVVWSPLVVRVVATTRREDATHVEERLTCHAYAFTREPIRVAPLVFRAEARDGSPERRVEVAAPQVRVLPAPESRPASAPELPSEFFAAPRSSVPAILGACLGFVIAGLGWLGWSRRRLRRPVTRDARAAALARLATLRSATPNSRAEQQALHREVTDLVRTTLAFPPQWTSEEVLASVTGERRERAARFFAHCDLVKFADHTSSADERAAMFAVAEQLVRG